MTSYDPGDRSMLAGGTTRVVIALTAPGRPLDRLRLRIEGAALGSGGVRMSAGQMTLGTSSDPGAVAANGTVTATAQEGTH